MATNLSIGGVHVKQRSAAGVLGLSFITAGIYFIYWYYQLNRELRDLGEDVSPGMSALAISLGSILIVPSWLSMYNTGERLKRQGLSAGVASNISGGYVVVMMLLSFLIVPYFLLIAKMQGHANEIYARRAAVGNSAQLGAAAPTALAWPEQPAVQQPTAGTATADPTGHSQPEPTS